MSNLQKNREGRMKDLLNNRFAWEFADRFTATKASARFWWAWLEMVPCLLDEALDPLENG